ncbi:hypothetical protein J6590_046832 [Homalodisca vitripennis]|nr:hypothetical protein J6590_046832 [Homalodisca vitripennis]
MEDKLNNLLGSPSAHTVAYTYTSRVGDQKTGCLPFQPTSQSETNCDVDHHPTAGDLLSSLQSDHHIRVEVTFL